MLTDPAEIAAALAAPFDPREVAWKPGAVAKDGTKALAMPYVSARAVEDRLDQVVGPANWQDSYNPVADGSVVCELRLLINGEWIAKVDVGGPSKQPDAGDRMKAAFSDALKRAAIKWGIARYLYRVARQWVEYDQQRRQFKQSPRLPDWAMPAGEVQQPGSPPPEQYAGEEPADVPATAGPDRPHGARPPSQKRPSHQMPQSGAELAERLSARDAELAAHGLCEPGELVRRIAEDGMKAGYDPDLTNWSGPALQLAVELCKGVERFFEHRRDARNRQTAAKAPPPAASPPAAAKAPADGPSAWRNGGSKATARPAQVSRINELFTEVAWTAQDRSLYLGNWGAKEAGQLTPDQADHAIRDLMGKVQDMAKARTPAPR